MVPMRSDKNFVMNKKAFQYDTYCPFVDREGGVLSRGCLAVVLSGRGGGIQGGGAVHNRE